MTTEKINFYPIFSNKTHKNLQKTPKNPIFSMEQIGVALQETLQPNAASGKHGEDSLRTLQANPGYVIQILQLAVNEQQNVAPEIRMAAAVALKNFVKRNWVGFHRI